MKKKFLALVLTLAMVLSLVPATALAANGTQEGNNQGPVEVTGSDKDNNLTMKKTVTPVQNKDGTYTVRLESYAKGEVTTTTTTKQMDIVLLLDVSGSMGDQFTQDIEKYQPVYKDSLDTSKTYLVKQGWWYNEVTYCPTCNKWTRGCSDSWWTGNHREGKIFIPTETENDTNNKHTQFYQYVYISGQNKMDALKTAVNQFIEGIAENSPQSNISIVKFAGEKTDKIGNNTNTSGKNYTQIVKELTKVDNAERVNQLKNAVSQLQASGSTASDYGLEKAQEALKSANQDKVVVLFTDGEPNHQNGFDYKVATDAVNTAKTLKEKDTTIYTVGVFKNPSDDINLYMSSVSSNHPNATAQYIPGGLWENDTWTVTGGDSDFGTYYKTADSADKLIEAFKTISSQVSSTNLNGNAVVVDKVPSNFTAPISKDNVTLKVADYKADGTFGTETAAPSTIHASVNEDGTVSVTGFDFSQNWCGLDSNKEPTGQKLIIEFTISRTNYGGTQPTNAGAYIKASSESTEKIIDLENPEVPVTVQLPDQSNPYTDTKTYDGAGFDIKSEISEIIAGLVSVNGINNKFIDLTYEIKNNEGNTVGTYTIPAGETTGMWSADSTEIKTGSDVGNYTYKITVIGQDKKQSSNKNSKECTATFTITKREATFKGQTDTKVWNGQEQEINTITQEGLLTGHTYEGLTYAATGTNTGTYDGKFTGTAIIKDADGTNVTANYNVKTEPGTLTITNSTSTATVTFKIVGGKWSDDNTAKDKTVQVTLTNGKGSLAEVDIPTGSPSDGHTGPGVWSNDAGITGDPVEGMEITQNTLFTLTYPESKPVESEVDVTFKIDGGKWSNGKTEDITRVVKLTNGTGSLAGVEIPTGVADAEHQGNGTWTPVTPEAGTEITQDGNKVFTLTFQKKEEQKPADPVKLDVSRSKIASGLTKNSNGDWTTNVKLSLPSAEEELASDVVFVLDTSDCVGTVMDQVSELVTQLKAAQESSGAEIKVGVVAFKGSALPMFGEELVSVKKAEETLTKMIDEVKAVPLKDGKPDKAAQEQAVMKYLDADTNFIYKGSNLHSGLLGAQELLKKDTAVSNTRKYVVTITDGMTYYWNKGDDVYGVYGGSNADNTAEANLLFYTWCGVHGIDTEGTYKLPETFSWDT